MHPKPTRGYKLWDVQQLLCPDGMLWAQQVDAPGTPTPAQKPPAAGGKEEAGWEIYPNEKSIITNWSLVHLG